MNPTVWSNAHGALTHFPISLMLVSAFCDWASLVFPDAESRATLRSSARVTLAFSALGACGAAITGLAVSRGQAWGYGALRHHHQFVWPASALMLGLATWRLFFAKKAETRPPTLYLGLTALAAILVGGAGYWGGELINGASTAPETALPAPASAERGRHLFVQSCAHCHGDDAHGSGEDGDGPDLYALPIGNARIATVIHGGIPEEMPSFAKKHGPADIADLTAYLRQLH
jgi:mono/diheme cytochrome c family protein